MYQLIRRVIICLLFCIPLLTNAQNIKVGGSLAYNIRTKGIGIGARAKFPIKAIDLLEGVSVVPQLMYYPPIANYHEFYLGSDVHVGVYSITRWNFYGLANIAYNGWINHTDTINRRNPKYSNLAFELGGGVNTQLGKCWHPFFELRCNVKWWDPSIQLGILYTLKCDRRGAVPCSRIPKQPYEFFKE